MSHTFHGEMVKAWHKNKSVSYLLKYTLLMKIHTAIVMHNMRKVLLAIQPYYFYPQPGLCNHIYHIILSCSVFVNSTYT